MAGSEERNIGGFTVDRSLVVRAWDPWIARITGVRSDDARGRLLKDVLPGIENRGLPAVIREVIAHGTVRVLAPAFHRYLIACAPLRPSRHFQQMQQHVTVGPLREGDVIIGAIVTIEDVTRRMEAERDVAGEEAPESSLDQPDAFRAAMRDADWRTRRLAAEVLARRGGNELVSSLLAALREEHQNFAVVSSALQMFAQMNLDVVGPLVEFLSAPEPDLRMQGALGLGEQADPRAIPALVRALDDPDTNVRFHAVEALGKLRAQSATGALVRLAVSGNFFVAFAALDAIARIGDPAVAKHLVPLLQDEALRSAVVDTLGQLGDEAAVAPLVNLLDQPGAPVEAVAQALLSLQSRSIERYGEGTVIGARVLEYISPHGVQSLIDAVKVAQGEALRALAIVLGWLEGEQVERTLALLLGHPSVRHQVVEGLVRFGPRVTELLIQQLHSPDSDTRQAAVIALGRIGDRRATGPLLDLIEKDREMALTGAGALARIGDQDAFERLMRFVADPDAAVRQAVVAALNSIGHPLMAERVRVLIDDPDPRARESAVKIAGYFGYPGCVESLFARSHDEDEDVRRVAVEHLPFTDDDRVVSTLVAALRDDTPRVRAAAAHALGRVDAGSAVAPLVGALSDADAWVRYFAARSIGRHRVASAVGALSTLIRSDQAVQVRLAAIDALGAIGGPEAIAVLAPLCEGLDDMAAAAIRAVGRIDDERAWPPLKNALASTDPRLQMEALRVLADRGGLDAIGLIEWVAASTADPTIAREAIEGLGRMARTHGGATTQAIQALVRLTADPGQRPVAVVTLGALPATVSADVARGLSDPNPDVRCAVVDALGRMHDERATAWLRMALDDPAPEVRKTAVGALAHLGSRGTESRLAAIARTDADEGVRRAARLALGYPIQNGET